jgi:RNA polymerase sigma factor (sigma-70 family)
MGRTGTVTQPGTLREYLRVLAGSRRDPPQADGQLLARYVADRDEAAFAALVERYGTLVLGVCNRVLQDPHAAEDAFQATFLVLVRRAATLDGEGPLGNWLYAVAYRTAVKARQNAARRRAHERQVLEMPPVPAAGDDQPWDDLRPLLDEELNQLPEKYRAPLVLCFLEGKSHQEAARELGWPSGSMSRRMSRARELLRQRLARRGLALSTGLLFALITSKAKAAAVTPALANMTAQAAVVFGAGKASAGATVAAHVAALADEILATSLAVRQVRRVGLGIKLTLLAVFGLAGSAATPWAWGLMKSGALVCDTASHLPARSEMLLSAREVQALGLSPDGRLLAAGTSDPAGPLHVWRLADNQEWTLPHSGPVSAVAFSPDGNLLAAGGDNGQVTLQQPAGSQKPLVLPGGRSKPVRALAFAPDGRTLASAGQDGMVRLWKLPSPAEPISLSAPASPLAAVAYSADGKLLAAAGAGGMIRIWDAASCKPTADLPQKTGEITSLNFAPAGTLLASGSTDKIIRVWDVATRKVRRTMAGHAAAVQAVVFARSENRLFSASKDGAMRAWDLVANPAGDGFPGHLAEVKALVAARDCSRLASAALDGIKIWDAGPP